MRQDPQRQELTVLADRTNGKYWPVFQSISSLEKKRFSNI